MSTATGLHRQITANGEHRDSRPVLDAAIEQTNKQKSLVGTAASVLGVPTDKLCDLLRNVWKTSKDQPPLTNQEMFVGISMIARYELDPIAREVYVTRGKGGIFTIISIDGWIKVLDRTDHYDGFTVDIHEEKPGEIDWIETTIYSKKRSKPTSYRAYAAEYARIAGMVAKLIPSHMLRIFSLRHAARLFTPIGGAVLTEEEALFIARDEPAQTQRSTSIDELEASLTAPIQQAREELPETSYEPKSTETQSEKTIASEPSESDEPKPDEWTQFIGSVKAAKTLADLTHCSDYWLAKERDFGPARNTEALAIVRLRETEIRAGKGKQAQGTLV